MFQMLKFFVVSISCAMFALIVRSACEEKKSDDVETLVSRLRRSGF